MPLQQTSADAVESATVYSAPVSDIKMNEAETNHDAPRYDTTAVKDILARAEAMQMRHQETLAAGDIEAIGEDLGVKSDFVRRALAQIEAEPQATGAAGNGVRRILTHQDWKSAAIPEAIYALLVPLVLLIHPILEGGWSFVLPVYIPALVAFGVGFKKCSKRLGAWGGALIAFAGFVYGMLDEWFVYAAQKPSLEKFVSPYLLLLVSIYLVFGVLPGVGGALLRRWIGETGGSEKRLRLHLSFDSDPKGNATQTD